MIPGVSRETSERLAAFVAELEKWNARINLVSRSSDSEIWKRHVEDSAQLFPLRSEGARHWVDIGTGGGFPGLVIAILAAEADPDLRVSLIESDARKAAFLGAAARAAGVSPAILVHRAEEVPPMGADVLSARALAPLPALLPLAERHLAPAGRALFPKGRAYEAELRDALALWRARVQKYPSTTAPDAVILTFEGVTRV